MALHDKYRKKYRQADRRAEDSARVRQRIADEAARRLLPRIVEAVDSSASAESQRDGRLDLDRLDTATLYEAKRKAAAVLGVRVRPGELPADTEVRLRLVELARRPGSNALAPMPQPEDSKPDQDPNGLNHDPSSHLDRFQIYRMTLLPLEQVKQDPIRHPEGDALYHALQVFDQARRRLPYDEEFLLAALLHDVGMAIDPRDHVAAGLEALRGAISQRSAWLIRHHHTNVTDSLRRSCPDPHWIEDLKLLRECDLAGRVPGVAVETLDEVLEFLRQLADDDGDGDLEAEAPPS
ncbi:hypothetical protein Isop_2012 [Isosphaera pallida ATCC 43644]|jgi:hypothetical protein|uniref:HD domain-containing protein n=1 Tax=Isosphaera pallida (strain ATCC 43644 / DSM 9630 / IS1B) TaxID=575540 RepID=E8R373_ISOPI|nr:HD domain-containing protein [Isosphaera pallida]ADV62592.1 hypothetical protein Isop_2012 [Isosphaera pallida ATCC 43644]